MASIPFFRTRVPGHGPWAALLAAALVLGALPGRAPAADSPVGSDWPRQFVSASGAFVLYQPQPEELQGDLLSARAAFSVQRDTSANPGYGVLWFNAHVLTDRDSSMVTLRDLDVTKVRMPGITAAEAADYEHRVEAEAKSWDLSGPLVELQTGLAAADREKASVANLDNTPPRIVLSYERAILVVFDGTPTPEAIEGTDLERIVNTPYAIVYDPERRNYYLNGANLWYVARDPLGPWTTAAQPPADVRAVVPPDTSADDQVLDQPPRVLTATEPTELIAFDGQPAWAPIGDGELLYASNTESDVFREVSSQAVYVLIAGRWFRAASFDGPWTFVRSDLLPEAFRLIPVDSPKASVLACVAGTDQAADALADEDIAQTSAIDRSYSDVSVTYDGEPDFGRIEGTDLLYAVNTDAEVILANGQYYLCDQGVWYIADSPNGPWKVSETRPLGIEDIPPDCPIYDVRYVVIFSVTPDVIYEGYYPGYLGCYPYYGTVVYGTGHHYRPWHGRHRYYGRPWTWGIHARYNPWLGRWSQGYSFGAPFLRTGYRWRSPGPPGQPARRPTRTWFGSGGFHRPFIARDLTLLRTRPPARMRRSLPGREPANLYNRPDNEPRVNREALRIPWTAPARPAVALPFGQRNDAFAGKDGKVYRRDDAGRWNVNERGNWRPTPTPAPAPRPAPRVLVPARPVQPPPAQGGGGLTRILPRPATPSPAPPSGDLESAFRARERSRQGASIPPPSAAPTPRPAPVQIVPQRPAPAPRAPERPSPPPASVDKPAIKPAPETPPPKRGDDSNRRGDR